MNSKSSTSTVIGPIRVAYQQLLTPQAQNGSGEKKFSLTMHIPKSNPLLKQSIEAAIEAATQEGLQSKWNGAAPPNPVIPIYDGDGLRPNGEKFSAECRGNYVMTASSKSKPEVVDIALQPIINESEIYNGMYAYVSINFFAYSRSGKKGIGCGLNSVMKYQDGEPLGGKITAAKAFGPVLRQIAEQNPGNLPFTPDPPTSVAV